MKRNEPNREANIWIARAVPVVLLGLIGYSAWVITRVLCVDYLLRPKNNVFPHAQTGPAIAILVLYYLLLCITLVCYARLIYVVTRHPGLVPRGPQWHKQTTKKPRRSRRRRHRSSVEESKNLEPDLVEDRNTSETVTNSLALDADLQVGDFWQKDVFTCGHDGRPAFCSTCYNWKPDRAHHCSELDRCVLKMDHFCPWVGGVVGETSFKFFIQFTFWAALLCTHILVSIAYYFAQRRRVEGVINVHWTVILAISGFFLFFSAGMCMSSLQFAFINSTTIENLSRKRKVWYLAVHVPNHVLEQMEERGRSNLRLITYPRPAAEHFQVLEQHGADVSQEALDKITQGEAASRLNTGSRTFAILETPPGVNPFDLGYKQNFVDMMGASFVDWMLPWRPSPCVRHDLGDSFYRMGPTVGQLKYEARIFDGTLNHRKRSKRKRRLRSENLSSRNGQTAQAVNSVD